MFKLRSTRMSSEGLGRNNSGFTLIELMIAVGMFSFVLLLIVLTFIQISQAYTQGLTTKRVHEETRTALETISRDLRAVGRDAAVEVYCDESVDVDCKTNLDAPTDVLCLDGSAYVFAPTSSPGEEGRLGYIENVSCADVAMIDREGGTSLFGDRLRPHFFRVTELVGGTTYRIELAVSVAGTGDDLIADIDTAAGEGIRDYTCDPSEVGSQYCRVVLLSTIVTVRGER